MTLAVLLSVKSLGCVPGSAHSPPTPTPVPARLAGLDSFVRVGGGVGDGEGLPAWIEEALDLMRSWGLKLRPLLAQGPAGASVTWTEGTGSPHLEFCFRVLVLFLIQMRVRKRRASGGHAAE